MFIKEKNGIVHNFITNFCNPIHGSFHVHGLSKLYKGAAGLIVSYDCFLNLKFDRLYFRFAS